MPRSMRRTFARPQLRAMSVAFDDQGYNVPTRGVMSINAPLDPDSVAESP